jgi:iron complex outermembrane receptor protein
MNQVAISTGNTDLTAILNTAAPSLNYNKQSGSDGADHIDLATLRGLGPDQTLVLLNGKRRHQTAFVSYFGTRGRGNSGTDLSALPVAAIDRVEILRDGASAQYGSDAIAGVINIILKQDVNKLTSDMGYAVYNDPKYNTAYNTFGNEYPAQAKLDGQTFNANLNYGLPIGKKGGFINFTGRFEHSGKTYRQVLDTTNPITNPNALPLNTTRRAYGDASLTGGSVFFNAQLPLSSKNNTSFYAFGGFNAKSSDAYAFTRNWSQHPERFPQNSNGTMTQVPGIIVNAPSDAYYNPHIQTTITDLSFAAGVKGVTANEWHWDFSNTIGYNNFHFYGDKTFNPSYGAKQTHFDDGGFSFLQNTTNLDFNKTIAKGVNLAFGAEFRLENYKLYAGEEASYKLYNPNLARGAQGFPGYSPADAVKANRSNIAAYGEAEFDITKAWLVDAAVRFENYSDFGFTSTYKLASRYKLADNFNLRGSISTGFRAPSLQQINFSALFTSTSVSNGQIQFYDDKLAPNFSPITKTAGIPDLKQETSVNSSFGFTWKPIPSLSITTDGYLVKVKDRVVLSGQFSASDPNLNPALAAAITAAGAQQAQFFANAVNTTNTGIDLVVDYMKRVHKHSFKVLFAGNLQHMTIDKVNVPAKLNDNSSHRDEFFSEREKGFVLASAPPLKFALTLEYGYNKFTAGTHYTYYGKITTFGYGVNGDGTDVRINSDLDPNVLLPEKFIFSGKVVSDLYVAYKLCKSAQLFIGADNLFNVHPDLGIAPGARLSAFDNETGGPWDAVQMGTNGRRLFARLAFNF